MFFVVIAEDESVATQWGIDTDRSLFMKINLEVLVTQNSWTVHCDINLFNRHINLKSDESRNST